MIVSSFLGLTYFSQPTFIINNSELQFYLPKIGKFFFLLSKIILLNQYLQNT